MFRGLLLALFVCTVAGCAPPAPETEDARPALWQATRGAVTLHLFGTIHVVPDDARWLNPVVRDAFDASDILVLEIVDEMTAQDRQALFNRLGQTRGLPPIDKRLDAARAAQFKEALGPYPATLHALPAYEDWAAALIIGSTTQAELKLSAEQAPEGVFMKRARARNMGVSPLETREEQLSVFDKLPPLAQKNLLRDAVDETGKASAQHGALFGAWVQGNLAIIDARLTDQKAKDPALLDALMLARNRAWVDKIDRWTRADQRSAFIAVGAAHMVGPEGLPALLANRGFTVRRIQ